jgi:hypothetical protein
MSSTSDNNKRLFQEVDLEHAHAHHQGGLSQAQTQARAQQQQQQHLHLHQLRSLESSHSHQPKRREQAFSDTPFPSFARQQCVAAFLRKGWTDHSLEWHDPKGHESPSPPNSHVQDSFFSAPVYYCASPNFMGCSSTDGRATAIPIRPRSDTTGTPLVVEGQLTKIKLLRVTTSAPTASNISTAISYSLETFNWSSHPDFIALSYVWGIDDTNNSILVNGEKCSIQSNLYSALSHFASDNLLTYLWADAICIDQTDEEEKSHVVQRMGDIFSRASRVIAWLGPLELTPETSQAGQWDLIDNLEHLGSLFWKKSGAGLKKLNEISPDLTKTLQLCLPELKERFGLTGDGTNLFPVSAYTQFSNNPYWQRIWVLQEVYLAQDLWFHCGPKAISMRTLSGALILLERFQRFIVSASDPAAILLRAIPRVRNFAIGSPSFPDMHRLIIYTSIYPSGIVSLRVAMANFCIKELPRGSRATDPRDMIFGLLGFVTEHEKGLHYSHSKISARCQTDHRAPCQNTSRQTTQNLSKTSTEI